MLNIRVYFYEKLLKFRGKHVLVPYANEIGILENYYLKKPFSLLTKGNNPITRALLIVLAI